jgi:uncharacterized membrane protein
MAAVGGLPGQTGASGRSGSGSWSNLVMPGLLRSGLGPSGACTRSKEVDSMDWVVVGAQWLHVLLGIIWFGNSLVVATILIPSLNRLPIPMQREVGARYGEQATRVFDVLVPAVIVLGVIRGTLLGPIKGVGDVFGSTYGITWFVALIAAIATFLWGRIVINGAIERMNAAPLHPDGTATVQLESETGRVKLVVLLELVGFVVIFTCMILMRFGL